MRNSISLQKEIAEAQATIQLLHTENVALEARYATLEADQKRKTADNPLAKKREMCDFRGFMSGLIGVIVTVATLILGALLYGILWAFEAKPAVTNTVMIVCAVILAIGIAFLLGMVILKSMVKILDKQLRSFDQKIQLIKEECRDLKKQIEENKNTIEGKKERIAACEVDAKYLPYAQNHVMIYVAEEGGSGNTFRAIRHSITIDNIDYGAASMPFKAIELTPGVHAVGVKVALYIGGEPHIYSSPVTQVRVDTNSVFMQYVFKGPGMPFAPMQYYNASDFFKATNQNH